MDSTTNNYDILMRLINNALYWQHIIIIVILMIVIDTNEQKWLIHVRYSIHHEKMQRCLNRRRVHLKLYSLKINKCTNSNWIQTINVRNLLNFIIYFLYHCFFQNDLQCIKYLHEVIIQPSSLKIMKHLGKGQLIWKSEIYIRY